MAQNVLLQATALGLGAVPVGGFEPKDAQKSDLAACAANSYLSAPGRAHQLRYASAFQDWQAAAGKLNVFSHPLRERSFTIRSLAGPKRQLHAVGEWARIWSAVNDE